MLPGRTDTPSCTLSNNASVPGERQLDIRALRLPGSGW